MSNLETLMDMIKVEDREGKTVEAKVPLGLEGATLKAEEVVATGDRERALRLAERVDYMGKFAEEFLTKHWGKASDPRFLEESEVVLDSQLRARAKELGGRQFLMDLGSSPTEDNPLARLALQHSVIVAAKSGGWEQISMALPEKYAALGQSLEQFGQGRSWTAPAYVTKLKGWRQEQGAKDRVKETAGQTVGAPVATEADSLKKSVGEKGLEALKSEAEVNLVKEIKGALESGAAFGFSHNRWEGGGKKQAGWEGRLGEGLGNRLLVNVSLKEAEGLYSIVNGEFPGGAYDVRAGEAALRLITNPAILKEPRYDRSVPEKDRTRLLKFKPDQALLRLGYHVDEADRNRRSGTWIMYLGLPQDLAERVFDYAGVRPDDPTAAVRILGHALGEDLDINYEKDGKDQFAKLDVKKIKLERS